MLAIINYLRMNLRSWTGSEKGASAVEYTLLLVLIAVVLITVITTVGLQLNLVWAGISTELDALPE